MERHTDGSTYIRARPYRPRRGRGVAGLLRTPLAPPPPPHPGSLPGAIRHPLPALARGGVPHRQRLDRLGADRSRSRARHRTPHPLLRPRRALRAAGLRSGDGGARRGRLLGGESPPLGGPRRSGPPHRARRTPQRDLRPHRSGGRRVGDVATPRPDRARPHHRRARCRYRHQLGRDRGGVAPLLQGDRAATDGETGRRPAPPLSPMCRLHAPSGLPADADHAPQRPVVARHRRYELGICCIPYARVPCCAASARIAATPPLVAAMYAPISVP